MAGLEYDVVFYDSVSSVYTENTPEERGIGGSELSIITLSKELAQQGFSVLVLNDPISRAETTPHASEPIVSSSGVHYASYRAKRPPIHCTALVSQRFSRPPIATIDAEQPIDCERLVTWHHDGCSDPGEPVVHALREATRKPPTRGGATPIFVSEWQRSCYPPDSLGRHSRIIPNMLPRALFDPKWDDVEQLDTMVFASAAARGLDATLSAWADERVRSAGPTILEVMGPAYDPPPADSEAYRQFGNALHGRVRVMGSLTLSALVDRMARSRGLVFANTWPETFCLLVAYAEALGKPARFIGLSPFGVGGVIDTMQNAKRFLYGPKEWERFVNDLSAEISAGETLRVPKVTKFHPDAIMPLWYDVLGIEP